MTYQSRVLSRLRCLSCPWQKACSWRSYLIVETGMSSDIHHEYTYLPLRTTTTTHTTHIPVKGTSFRVAPPANPVLIGVLRCAERLSLAEPTWTYRSLARMRSALDRGLCVHMKSRGNNHSIHNPHNSAHFYTRVSAFLYTLGWFEVSVFHSKLTSYHALHAYGLTILWGISVAYNPTPNAHELRLVSGVQVEASSDESLFSFFHIPTLCARCPGSNDSLRDNHGMHTHYFITIHMWLSMHPLILFVCILTLGVMKVTHFIWTIAVIALNSSTERFMS